MRVNGLRPRVGHADTDLEKENAASFAGDSGAIVDESQETTRGQDTLKRSRSAISRFGKDEHKRAAKMLGYCLILGTPAAWGGLAPVLRNHLTPVERMSLAAAALASVEDDDIDTAIWAALGGEAA